MNTGQNQLERKFLLNWVKANGLGWIVGGIIAIILSYLVVNFFYPKETNLILGLCIGASIGYAQWFVLRQNLKISSLWGLACTICMGIPFIAMVIADEIGFGISYSQGGSEILGRLIFGLIIGLVIGLLQFQFLRSFFDKAVLWIPLSSIGWGMCFLISSVPMPFALLGVLSGGVILGLITGYGLILMDRSGK